MGMTHWTPDGGRIAECGESTQGELAVASMAGVNCPVCLEMVMLRVDSARFVDSEEQEQQERSGYLITK